MAPIKTGVVFVPLLVILACASAACHTSPQAKEAVYLKRAKEFLDKKDFGRALLELRNAQQAMPNDAEPYFQTGVAQLSLQAIPQAFNAFRKAVELNPKHTGAQLKIAELMLASRNKDQMEQAVTRLRDVLQATPEDTEAIDAMAVAEMRLGKTTEAADRLEETLRKFPSDLQSSVILTRAKLAQRDFAGAEDVLKRAVAQAPKSAQAAMALGEYYIMLKRPREAEAEFRRAVQLDPANGPALLRLADLQTVAVRNSEAEQTLQTLSGLPEQRYKPLHAVYLFRTGKRDEAVTEFEKLVKNYPDDRTIRGELVGAYLELGKLPEAEKLLAAALKKNPKDADALLQRSTLEMKTGNPEQAGEDLRQAAKFVPSSAKLHFALAVVYAAQGSARSERTELLEAVRLDPTQMQVRAALARNLANANNLNEALRVLDEAPARQRQILGLVVERNWVLLALQNYKEVRASLDSSMRVSRHPELVLQDGVLRLRTQDYTGARLAADEVLRQNPEDVRAAELLADSYAAQKQTFTAAARLSELAASHPKSAPLQELLGQWQIKAGHLPEARTAFEAAKSADPKFVSAELDLAQLDRQEKHADRAVERLTAIVTADPKNIPAFLILAAINEEANDTEAANTRYRTILNIDSSNLFALNNLAYHMALTDSDEALKLAQSAMDVAPGDPSIQDTMGWVYYRKGNYQTAVQHFKSAVDKDPSPKHQFHLALSYLKAGQQNLGAQMLQSALQRDPTLPKTERGW